MKKHLKYDPDSQNVVNLTTGRVLFKIDPELVFGEEYRKKLGAYAVALPELYAFVESYAQLPCSCDDTNPGGCESCGARLLIDAARPKR